MIYDLPTSLPVCGTEYEIRSDYRAILDIIIALNDPELTDSEKVTIALLIFYPSFEHIVAPVNRVIGREIRAEKYLHWWTFLSAYMEIGECTFAQIVHIRSMKASGKQLSKQDKEWYAHNRSLVDLPTKYTSEEEELLKKWGGVRNGL